MTLKTILVKGSDCQKCDDIDRWLVQNNEYLKFIVLTIDVHKSNISHQIGEALGGVFDILQIPFFIIDDKCFTSLFQWKKYIDEQIKVNAQ